MLTFKLALRNILGAGTRTWLNVVALSFSFVVIVFVQGIYNGLNDQVEKATVDAFYGGGQYWQKNYDPYDPLTLTDAHEVLPESLRKLVAGGDATPILIRQATIYPGGHFRAVLLKGIDPGQQLVSIPSFVLKNAGDGIPAVVGSRMAKAVGLRKGDQITVQWRDAHGTYDARDVTIMEIMKTPVQEIDNEQIWIPLNRLQELSALPGQATIVILNKSRTTAEPVPGWVFRSRNYLLQDIHALARTKTISASILYAVLLFLALLAVFDTQVLSIFRRRKEIGTLMALGMTRTGVIRLFTVEGGLYGILAAAAAAVWGFPLLAYAERTGLGLPDVYDTTGLAIGDKLYPFYSAGLIGGTMLLVMITTTIVSYLPTRRIVHLKPTDALRGKTS